MGWEKTKQTELEASECKGMSLFLPFFRGFWIKAASTHKSFILISALGAKATLSEKCLQVNALQVKTQARAMNIICDTGWAGTVSTCLTTVLQ